jgi:hypothetical protein
MKELRSFKDVIESRYYDAVWNAVSEYLSENADRLDLRSHQVERADEIALSDLTIKHVDIYDTPGDGIRFDVIAETELELSETVRRDRESDDASEWFRISCKGNLADGLHNFAVTGIAIYNPKKGGAFGKLTDNLVPLIPKENFDDVAEEFLRKHFSEALAEPMPVDVREVARRMGLTIKQERLSRHFTIFGEMVFADCEIEYYDPAAHAHKPMAVKRGTILVDPNIYFMRNLGCWNNTVIHECIHWEKHKKYHELAGMYDKSAARISCQVQERDRYKKNASPEDWMEWHANGIAPRVLMPKVTTTRKIEELIAKHEVLLGTGNRLDIMEGVLFELADFFQVPRMAAKIRMIDLGYREVEGVAIYVDDHYISSYAFAAESKSRTQTFSISLSDAFFEYFVNPAFRSLIDSGNFTYVDGHYVINDPKYVQRSSFGGVTLTDYAKLHVDECCIRFDLKFNPSAKNDIVVYLDKVEFRKATPDYSRVPEFHVDDHNNAVFARSEELKKFHEEYSEEITFLQMPVTTFAATASAHIQRLGLSRKEFCDKTLLSEKTYDRIKTNTAGRVTLQTVMQIAIGLELGGLLGEQLIELAGYKLTNKEIGYKKVLYGFKGHSIFECDEVLTALGLESIIPKQYRSVE